MQEIILYKIFWKRIIKKTLKSLLFLSKPVLFNGQNYGKQKGPGTGDQYLCKLQNKFRKTNPFLVVYYLTKVNDLI